MEREDDLALLYIEQHACLALEFCARVIVFDRGRIIFSGIGRDLLDVHDRLANLLGVSASPGV